MVLLDGRPVFCLNARDDYNPPFGVLDYIGWAVWAIGFGLEVTADRQKGAWRAVPTNAGKWIDVGLWSVSRHPNYFGEITLWCGAFLSCASAFGTTPMWVSVISPFFVALLICKLSGIPMLETRADEKWGGNAAYEAYKSEVPVLVPNPCVRRTGAPMPMAAADALTPIDPV